jgi:hypothetical protein
MNAPYVTEIPKFLLVALNQLYDMERKLALHGDAAGVGRNVQRVKEAFADGGLFYDDPMGQPFVETRTDLEASIAGAGTENLKVTEVIKPVIRYGDAAYSRVIQKGIVVVRSDVPPPLDPALPNQAQA